MMEQQAYGPRTFPSNFTPGWNDVICGRGGDSFNHEGNRRFRMLIEQWIPAYQQAKTKTERGRVVTGIMNHIYSANGGCFVKRDHTADMWLDIGETKAREKVGHAIRVATIKQDDREQASKEAMQTSGLTEMQSEVKVASASSVVPQGGYYDRKSPPSSSISSMRKIENYNNAGFHSMIDTLAGHDAIEKAERTNMVPEVSSNQSIAHRQFESSAHAGHIFDIYDQHELIFPIQSKLGASSYGHQEIPMRRPQSMQCQMPENYSTLTLNQQCNQSSSVAADYHPIAQSFEQTSYSNSEDNSQQIIPHTSLTPVGAPLYVIEPQQTGGPEMDTPFQPRRLPFANNARIWEQVLPEFPLDMDDEIAMNEQQVQNLLDQLSTGDQAANNDGQQQRNVDEESQIDFLSSTAGFEKLFDEC